MITLSIVHRSSSSIHQHRRALYATAATGVAGILMAVTLNSAYAMPGRGDSPPVPAVSVRAHGHYVGHGCFMTPHSWNEALAGPMPRCYTYVP